MTAPMADTAYTGWPPGLLQDDSRELSRWFASRPDSRRLARLAAQEAQAARQPTPMAYAAPEVRAGNEAGLVRSRRQRMADY